MNVPLNELSDLTEEQLAADPRIGMRKLAFEFLLQQEYFGTVQYEKTDSFETMSLPGNCAMNFSSVSLLVAVTLLSFTGYAAQTEDQAAVEQQAIEAIKALGGRFRNADSILGLDGPSITDAGLEHLKGLTELESLYIASPHVTDAGLEHLKGLTELKRLEVLRPPVTDAGLEHLKGLTELKLLALGSRQFTDAGLQHLKGLTELESLYIGSPYVTDAGLEHLKGLTELEFLYIRSPHVTDAGLEHLKGLTKLKSLYLYNTQITDAGLQEMKVAIPKCRIVN